MVISTTANLVEAVRQGELLDPAQFDELTRQLQPRHPDPRVLGKELLARGWLTSYQIKHIFQGLGSELRLGHYVLLDRIGEGGMGEVYKARHLKLNRVVALKVIRKDFVSDAEIVGRFYRELQVTSKLTHPNVVRGIEAGPHGSTHVMAMEYVEGTDLDRLVKENGPLPMAQACDYIRQAALGLQHIHEHGLVHRDIKPSNLLVTKGPGGGSIKILDLGLARLQESAHGKASTKLPDGKSVTTLTLNSSVTLGSVDYLSPEQALDFHRVDIRADIYSLGCALYYVLTGQPPFGNGPFALKLMRHQQAEPPDLKQARRDTPKALGDVFRRMLAKRPEDRYATPGDVATALEEILPPSTAPRPATAPAPTRRGPLFSARARWLLAGSATLLVGSLLLCLLFMPWGPGQPPATATPVVAARSTLSAATDPGTNQPTILSKVLVGRAVVRDVLLDPNQPDAKLGAVPRDNAMVRGQNVSTVFLVRFDLAMLGVTPQAKVERGTVTICVWDPHDKANAKVAAFAVRTPWDEASATWQQAADGRRWSGGTHFVLGVDTSQALTHVVVLPDPVNDAPDPPVQYHYDITALVQSWVDGSMPNNGVALAVIIDRAIDGGNQSRHQIYASEWRNVRHTPRLTVLVRP